MATHIFEKTVRGNISKTSPHRATNGGNYSRFYSRQCTGFNHAVYLQNSGIAIGLMVLCVKWFMCWIIYFYWQIMFPIQWIH